MELNMKAALAMEPVVLKAVDQIGMNGAGLLIGLARTLELPEVRHHVLATLTDNEIEAALRNRALPEES
jgi:hypothetical protein